MGGIEALTQLEALDLFDCRKLSDLRGLERPARLRHLTLEACRRFPELPPFAEDSKLESVILTDCGKIRSLRPLAPCSALRELRFTGDTAIEDGDLVFLPELPRIKTVWFADRPNYTHTREELQALLF